MTNQLKPSEHALHPDLQKRAIAALTIAVAATAFSPILLKLAEQEVSPSAIIVYRLFIASVIFGLAKGLQLILSKFRKLKSELKPVEFSTNQVMIRLVATGIFFAAAHMTWNWSLTQTSVANSALLHGFTPVFITATGFLLLGQRFDSKFLIGMIVAIGGSVLLELDNISYAMNQIQGDVLALVSALFFAIYLLLVERIRSQMGVVMVSFCTCFIGTMAILPALLGSLTGIFPSSWMGWLEVVGLGLISVLNVGLTAFALKFLTSAFVGVALLLSPILTAIFAWVIFSEALNFYSLFAFPIILTGLYLTMNTEAVTLNGVSTEG